MSTVIQEQPDNSELIGDTKFRRSMAYRHPGVIKRMQEKLGISTDEASELFADVKRYLYLVSVSGKRLSPPRRIDDGWHEFILFTKDYQRFCQSCFGQMIHHQPLLKMKNAATPLKAPPSNRTVELARHLFGHQLSPNWGENKGSWCDTNEECEPTTACHGDNP